jgi:hypothetical protein
LDVIIVILLYSRLVRRPGLERMGGDVESNNSPATILTAMVFVATPAEIGRNNLFSEMERNYVIAAGSRWMRC